MYRGKSRSRPKKNSKNAFRPVPVPKSTFPDSRDAGAIWKAHFSQVQFFPRVGASLTTSSSLREANVIRGKALDRPEIWTPWLGNENSAQSFSDRSFWKSLRVVDVRAFRSWTSAPKCLFFFSRILSALTEVLGRDIRANDPGCPRDIRPKTFLFGLIFRSWLTCRQKVAKHLLRNAKNYAIKQQFKYWGKS